MSDSSVIVATELSRWYGIVMGLNNVSFEVPRGLTGLVGPNGAGKSTLMQIITGQLQPSSGTLTVFGEAPWNNPRALTRIGYCPEHEAVPTDLKPEDWLKGLGLLAGFGPAESAKRALEMLERVKLPAEAWSRRMGQYSKGMRQRVKLAQALLHQPELLILDEPMNGLDPMGRQEMAQIMRDLAASGTSILVSSHILAELEPICQEILIVNWGRIIATGSQFEIRADVKDWPEELQIQCDDPEKLAGHLFEAGVLLGFDVKVETGTLTFRVKDGPTFYARSLDLLLESGVRIHEVRSQSRSLKEIYEKVTA